MQNRSRKPKVRSRARRCHSNPTGETPTNRLPLNSSSSSNHEVTNSHSSYPLGAGAAIQNSKCQCREGEGSPHSSNNSSPVTNSNSISTCILVSTNMRSRMAKCIPSNNSIPAPLYRNNLRCTNSHIAPSSRQ